MVFISYSSKDMALADQLRAVLEENGIECWIAPRDIAPGMDYGEAIPVAIQKSKVFVLVLTEDSQASIWCTKELDTALTTGSIVVPFHADSSALAVAFNFRLTNVQRIEAYKRLEAAYGELVSFILKNDPVGSLDARTQTGLTAAENASRVRPAPSRKTRPSRSEDSRNGAAKNPRASRASDVSKDRSGTKVPEERVSDLVKGRLIPLLERGGVSEGEVRQLLDFSYSKKTFGMRRPVLKRLGPSENPSLAAKDSKGHSRYYVTPALVLGERYLVCSQWYRSNKPSLERWLALHEGANA